MENAGVELSTLVESGQLKLARPRVPASPTVASAATTSAASSGSGSAVANEPNLAADSEQAGKQNPARKPQSVPKVNMISAMSELQVLQGNRGRARREPIRWLDCSWHPSNCT